MITPFFRPYFLPWFDVMVLFPLLMCVLQNGMGERPNDVAPLQIQWGFEWNTEESLSYSPSLVWCTQSLPQWSRADSAQQSDRAQSLNATQWMICTCQGAEREIRAKHEQLDKVESEQIQSSRSHVERKNSLKKINTKTQIIPRRKERASGCNCLRSGSVQRTVHEQLCHKPQGITRLTMRPRGWDREYKKRNVCRDQESVAFRNAEVWKLWNRGSIHF